MERRWKEVLRRVQVRLPSVTAGAFMVLPPTDLRVYTGGDPRSPLTRLPVQGHAGMLPWRWVRDWKAGVALR